MLEGHVLRELILPSLRSTSFFTLHEIFHGISGPGFLFGAGFTFVVAAQRKWEQAITLNQKLFRRLWNAARLIGIGYLLHVPFLSLSKTMAQATPAQWNTFLAFDALQCIGLGLLIVRLLLLIVKEETWFLNLVTILLLTIVYVTPYFWGSAVQSTLPLWLSSMLDGSTGSPFPLFPCVGFLFAGTLTAWIFLRSAQEGNARQCINAILLTGIGLFAASMFLDALPFQSYPVYNFWHTSPNYFWMRIGMLLLMLGGLWYGEQVLRSHNLLQTNIMQQFLVLGVESMFVYIVHLVLLCGWTINVQTNLRWWWGAGCDIPTCLLISAGFILAMIPLALFWRYLKQQHMILIRGLVWWMGICVVWSFMFNPY